MAFIHSFIADIRLSRAPAMAFMAVGSYWGSFAALAPDLKAAIGASDGAFGLCMFFAALGAVAAMWLAPRVDAGLGARALQGCAVALGLAFLLPGLASGVVFFTLGMLFASAASGSLDVIMNLRISTIEARSGRSLMNLNHALFSFAYAGAAVVAGMFREAGFAPLTVFSVILFVTLLMVTLMHHALVPVKDDESTQNATLKTALIVIGGLIILIAFLTEQATEAWSALHLERGLGGSAAQGALGPAILGFTMGIGRLSGQFIAAKARETVVLQLAAVIAAMGLVIAGSAPSLAIAYAGFAILGLGVSVLAPMAYSAVGKRVSNKNRAIIITRISVIGYTGFFIGPPLMGGVSEIFSLSVSFYSVAVLLLLVSIFLAPNLRKQ